MKYFIGEKQRKESHSTCYFEFQKGKYDGKCWKEDSLSISDDDFHELSLAKIFLQVIPDFDYFGTTEVNAEQWEKIKSILLEKGGEYGEILTELEPWVCDNFGEFDVFTVWGM